MKAEARHKLKSNQLADYIEQIQAWIKSHSRLLLGALVVVILGVGLFWFLHYRRASQQASAWNDLGRADKKYLADRGDFLTGIDLNAAADQYARIAKDFPSNQPVTDIALYRQACALAKQSRTSRNADQARRAEDVLKGIIDRQPYHPLVTPLARLELADLTLSAPDPNFNKVRELLTAVETDSKADGGVQQVARDRQSELGTPEKLTSGITYEAPIPPLIAVEPRHAATTTAGDKR